LRERAVRWLAQREHSRAELARKLARYAEEPTDIAPLLDELVRRKLLSDERYAEARARTLARKYGVSRIARELRAKGVDANAISRATQDAKDTEFARAREAWRKRFGAQPKNPRELAQQARFLQGRGFSFDIVRRIVRGIDDS
jgi:regulatory protein